MHFWYHEVVQLAAIVPHGNRSGPSVDLLVLVAKRLVIRRRRPRIALFERGAGGQRSGLVRVVTGSKSV